MADWPSGAVRPNAQATHSVDQSIISGFVTTALSFNVDVFKTHASMHDASASAVALTGTVAKSSASQTITGTGTSFLSEVSLGQLVTIPGTANETGVVSAIASNTSMTVKPLTGGGNFVNSASGQTATRDNTAKFIIPESGVYLFTTKLWAPTPGTAWILGIYKGTGTSVNDLATFSINSTTLPNNRISQTLGPEKLVAGDVLWLAIAQNAGSVQTLSSVSGVVSRYPTFGIIKVSD